MLNFRLYNKLIDIDLDNWHKKDYSIYYNEVNKYALFNESISDLYQSYKDESNQTGSIFDKMIVVEEDDLKVALIVVNYFISEKDNKKVLGINPIIINPKYIKSGYGKKIVQYIIECKGRIFDMIPDRIYAGIDITNEVSLHLFESFGFRQVGKTSDNEFLYYELEL